MHAVGSPRTLNHLLKISKYYVFLSGIQLSHIISRRKKSYSIFLPLNALLLYRYCTTATLYILSHGRRSSHSSHLFSYRHTQKSQRGQRTCNFTSWKDKQAYILTTRGVVIIRIWPMGELLFTIKNYECRSTDFLVVFAQYDLQHCGRI